MKKVILLIFLFLNMGIYAQNVEKVISPDGNLRVEISITKGTLNYSVFYLGEKVLNNSPLKLFTNEGNFDSTVTFVESAIGKDAKVYEQKKIKHSQINFSANTLKYTVKNAEGNKITILFKVSDNDIAFRYEIPKWGDTRAIVVEQEKTGFNFPEETTAFLSNEMRPMTGFARTAPSYESAYQADQPITEQTAPGGYVFP